MEINEKEIEELIELCKRLNLPSRLLNPRTVFKNIKLVEKLFDLGKKILNQEITYFYISRDFRCIKLTSYQVANILGEKSIKKIGIYLPLLTAYLFKHGFTRISLMRDKRRITYKLCR